MVKRLLQGVLFSLFFVMVQSSFANSEQMQISIDLHNQNALRHGAQIFMNYCSGCHSLRYLRYRRLEHDLGLKNFTNQQDAIPLINNLIFTTATVDDPVEISLPPVDARQWFGMLPPDLSLTARQRGAVWVYNFLHGFYSDPHRPFGTNNILVPDVAMPNVLESLQKELSKAEFDNTLNDLVTFLVYVAEPIKLFRIRIGFGVILFLCIFIGVVYRLKKSYWQKIAY